MRDIRSSIRSTIIPPAYSMRGTAPSLSVLLIGTAETGPVNEIVVPRSMLEAEEIFGSLGRGNLLEAYHEFILGSSRGTDLRTMVGLMRVDIGEKATLELPERTTGEGESAPESPAVTAFTLTAIYQDAISNDIRVAYRVTDYGPAVVITLPASLDPSGDATDYIFRCDLTGTDTTLINTLVDLRNSINTHRIVGRFIRAEVNTINRTYASFFNFDGTSAFSPWNIGVDGSTLNLIDRLADDADGPDDPSSDALGDFTPVDLYGNDNSGELSTNILRSVDDITIFNNVLMASNEKHTMDAGAISEDPEMKLYAIDYESFNAYPMLALHDYDNDGFYWSKPNYHRNWGTPGEEQFRLPGYFPTSEAYFDLDVILNPDGSASGNIVKGSLLIPPDPFTATFNKDIFRWHINASIVDTDLSINDGGRNITHETGFCVPIRVFDANILDDSDAGAVNVFRIPDAVFDGGENEDPKAPDLLTSSDDITVNFYNNGDGFQLDDDKWYIFKVKDQGVGYLNIGTILKVAGILGTGDDLGNVVFKVYVTGSPSDWGDDISPYNFTANGTASIDISSADTADGYVYIAFKFHKGTGGEPTEPVVWVSAVYSSDVSVDVHDKLLRALANANGYNVLFMNGDNDVIFHYTNGTIGGELQGYGVLSAFLKDSVLGSDVWDWYVESEDNAIDSLNSILSTRNIFTDVDNYEDHDFKILYSINSTDWYEVPLSWVDFAGNSRRSFLAKWVYNGQDDIDDNTNPNEFTITFIPDSITENDVSVVNSTFPYLDASWDSVAGSASIEVKPGYVFRTVGKSSKFLMKYTTSRPLLDKWNEYTIDSDVVYFAHAFNNKMNYNLFTAKSLTEGVHFSYDKSSGSILITDDDLIPDTDIKNVLLQFDYDYEPEWFDTSITYQLSGGTDGIDEITPLNYKKAMEKSLDVLKTQAIFDIVVPKGAYIDETDYVYDPMTGRSVEKNVGFFDLFNNFTTSVSTESPMTFILSIKPFLSSGRVGYTSDEITDWYNRLTDTSNTSPKSTATMVGSSTNFALAVLSQPFRIPAPGGLTYISDGASYIAGLAARLKYDSMAALTSTLVNADLVNGVTPAFRVPYDYEDGLLNMRYIVANVRDDGTYRIVRDYTLDDPRGALRHLTHVFVVQSIKHELISGLKSFIGQTLNEKVKIAIYSAIQNVLRPWTTNGVIQEAPFEIHWDRVDNNIGIIPITVRITRSPIIQGATLNIEVR